MRANLDSRSFARRCPLPLKEQAIRVSLPNPARLRNRFGVSLLLPISLLSRSQKPSRRLKPSRVGIWRHSGMLSEDCRHPAFPTLDRRRAAPSLRTEVAMQCLRNRLSRRQESQSRRKTKRLKHRRPVVVKKCRCLDLRQLRREASQRALCRSGRSLGWRQILRRHLERRRHVPLVPWLRLAFAMLGSSSRVLLRLNKGANPRMRRPDKKPRKRPPNQKDMNRRLLLPKRKLPGLRRRNSRRQRKPRLEELPAFRPLGLRKVLKKRELLR